MKRFFDISMELHEEMMVYPNNPQLRLEQYASIPSNETNETKLIMGVHAGTHVDAKKHISNEGTGSLAISLNNFYGQCQVLDISGAGLEIHRKTIESYDIKRGEIILLKTLNSKRSYDSFNPNYAHLKNDAAEYLVSKKIKTLGFDYLSVKRFQADPEVHEVLINKLTLIEGLNLTNIPEGKYQFIGFPLKLDADASPLRAVLLSE